MVAILNKHPKAIILLGTKGIETGIAVSLITSKSEKPVLNGWSVDVYGGKRLKTKEKTVGIGIGKTILDEGAFEVTAGIYATKPLSTFFDKTNYGRDINYSVGVAGRWKF